ncbi:shikimate kinase [Clostridia bacterium]|nr:shikimate kinase [Clostridia bacterium]
MKKSNIVLIGFMGTGKSVIGRKIAKELNMDFLDTDHEIEELVGMKIRDIFRCYGEKRFRSEETLVIKRVSLCENTVISCGGGVVLSAENVAALRRCGLMVELYADAQVIFERVKNNRNRPLLKGASVEDIEARYESRRKFYEVADIRIDTGLQNIEETVKTLKQAVSDLEGR